MQEYQKRTLWILGILLLCWALFLLQEAFFVLFSAFVLASALTPLVDRLDQRLPRWLAVLLPFTLFVLIAVIVVLPIAAMAIQQLQLLVADIPTYLEQTRQWTEMWAEWARRYPALASFSPESLLATLSSQGGIVFSGFTGITLTLSKALLNLLTVCIMSFFLVLDRQKIQEYGLHFISPRYHERLIALIGHLIQSTGAFVNGQILFMASFAALITLGLYWLNVPFATLFGLFAGALTIIPILGANIAMVPTLIFAFISSGDPTQVLWVFLLFVGVQMIENNILGPLIMGKAVGLHPLAIMLAILAGGLLFGMTGIVLAIPLASCLHIIVEEGLIKPKRVLQALPNEG